MKLLSTIGFWGCVIVWGFLALAFCAVFIRRKISDIMYYKKTQSAKKQVRNDDQKLINETARRQLWETQQKFKAENEQYGEDAKSLK